MNGKQAKRLRKEFRRHAAPLVVQEAQRLATNMVNGKTRLRVKRWFTAYLWAQRLWVKLGGTANEVRGRRLARRGVERVVVMG